MYLEEVSFEIRIALHTQREDACLRTNHSTVLGLGGMCPAELAGETHNDEICEVRYAGLAHTHFTHHVA